MKKILLAVAAHPDDIELRFAGTMLLMARAGWELHYLNIGTGSLGSVEWDPARTREIRREEARSAAAVLGARWHPPMAEDLEIFYGDELVRNVAAVVRSVDPSVILTHPPVDYMEDHTASCRLAVTAAFTKAIPNYRSEPPTETSMSPVAVYHSLPHGLVTPLGGTVFPRYFVDIEEVLEERVRALECHLSQKAWLEASQGLGALGRYSRVDAGRVGQMSGRFSYAEGWWPHLHLGFCPEGFDPLRDALGELVFEAPEWRPI
jgi:LmbE family N-acetylglucosaminyl deacetylase